MNEVGDQIVATAIDSAVNQIGRAIENARTVIEDASGWAGIDTDHAVARLREAIAELMDEAE